MLWRARERPAEVILKQVPRGRSRIPTDFVRYRGRGKGALKLVIHIESSIQRKRREIIPSEKTMPVLACTRRNGVQHEEHSGSTLCDIVAERLIDWAGVDGSSSSKTQNVG